MKFRNLLRFAAGTCVCLSCVASNATNLREQYWPVVTTGNGYNTIGLDLFHFVLKDILSTQTDDANACVIKSGRENQYEFYVDWNSSTPPEHIGWSAAIFDKDGNFVKVAVKGTDYDGVPPEDESSDHHWGRFWLPQSLKVANNSDGNYLLLKAYCDGGERSRVSDALQVRDESSGMAPTINPVNSNESPFPNWATDRHPESPRQVGD